MKVLQLLIIIIAVNLEGVESVTATATFTETKSFTDPTATFTETKSVTDPTATFTETKSVTAPTATFTETKSVTAPTATFTETKSLTDPTATFTETKSVTAPTATFTETKSLTDPTATFTETKSVTAPTATFTETKSFTAPTATFTETKSVTAPTATLTETKSFTAPTATFTETKSVTAPTATLTETKSFTAPTATLTETKSVTASVSPSVSKTLTVTASLSKSLTLTNTHSASKTVTISTSQTISISKTITQSITETFSLSKTFTVSKSISDSSTKTISKSLSLPTATVTASLTNSLSNSHTVSVTMSLSLPTRSETFSETRTISMSLPTRTESETIRQSIPAWNKVWYYQGPYSSPVFDIYPTEVVSADRIEFTFSGYRVAEGIPVVFIPQPEAGVRNYNICAELIPNEDWAVVDMPEIASDHDLITTLSNGTQRFKTSRGGYSMEDLVIDASTLQSDSPNIPNYLYLESREYYVCVRPDDNGWNALDTLITVVQQNSSDPYYGYQSCQQFIEQNSDFCGCYFSVGSFDSDDSEMSLISNRQTGWINIASDYSMERLLDIDTKSRYRSGCCTRLSSDSSVLTKNYPLDSVADSSGSNLFRTWGTCASSEDTFSSRSVY